MIFKVGCSWEVKRENIVLFFFLVDYRDNNFFNGTFFIKMSKYLDGKVSVRVKE